MENNKEIIAAGIVTFNPAIPRLKENIKSIAKQVKQIIIVDNGSTNIKEVRDICQENKCMLIELSDNKGIAFALNRICEYLYSLGFKWGITLDQDSVSPDDLVEKLFRFTTEEVGAIGPQIIYRGNERFVNGNKSDGVTSVEWIITSATLTNLNAWKVIGGFDNYLFIDGVDKDFCFRLKQNGFKVLQCNDVALIHELGNLKCRRILGKTIYVTNHSPKRKYYMARNAVYLDGKYHTSKSKLYVTKLFLKTLVYEDNKVMKIKSICKGVNDGRKKVCKRHEI